MLGDDAKNGEKVLKYKCTPQVTLPKDDDEAPDGGNK